MFERFQHRPTRAEAISELNARIEELGPVNAIALNPWTYDRLIGALKMPESRMPTVFVHFYAPGRVVAILRDWWGAWI